MKAFTLSLALLASLTIAPLAASASSYSGQCGFDRNFWSGDTSGCQNPNFPQGSETSR